MSQNPSSLDRLLSQEIKLEIEKMSITGEGVARYEGAVVFVPFSAPGDHLIARVNLVKKNFLRAEIIKIEIPSADRINALCPIYQKCGGCNWQHLSQNSQLREKQNILKELLQKMAPNLSFELSPIVASPKNFFYRNRIQPRVQNQELGFYSAKSHEWIKADDCFLVEEPLRDFFKKKQSTKAEKVELYLDTNGQGHLREISDEIEDQLFSQVNRFQNQNLIETVLTWTKDLNPSMIYDLYSGSGNFSFPLSSQFKNKTVVAVELNSQLVKMGRSKAAELKISPKNLEFYMSGVDQFLKRITPKQDALVILDPPRLGCSEFVFESLAASEAKNIIYISCHPVSLGRDLARLAEFCQSRGKKLTVQKIQAFEMFPQTSHFETIAELRIDSESSDAKF